MAKYEKQMKMRHEFENDFLLSKQNFGFKFLYFSA